MNEESRKTTQEIQQKSKKERQSTRQPATRSDDDEEDEFQPPSKTGQQRANEARAKPQPRQTEVGRTTKLAAESEATLTPTQQPRFVAKPSEAQQPRQTQAKVKPLAGVEPERKRPQQSQQPQWQTQQQPQRQTQQQSQRQTQQQRRPQQVVADDDDDDDDGDDDTIVEVPSKPFRIRVKRCSEFKRDPNFEVVRKRLNDDNNRALKKLVESVVKSPPDLCMALSVNSDMDNVTFHRDRFEVIVDARNFDADDIVCVVKGQEIEISAEKKSSSCSGAVTGRLMKRNYSLPQPINPDYSTCFLSKDGLLILTAPWNS